MPSIRNIQVRVRQPHVIESREYVRREREGSDGVDAPRRHRCAKVEVLIKHLKEASVSEVSTIGLDIAKQVFQAHGADASGHVLFRKRLTRAKLIEFFQS